MAAIPGAWWGILVFLGGWGVVGCAPCHWGNGAHRGPLERTRVNSPAPCHWNNMSMYAEHRMLRNECHNNTVKAKLIHVKTNNAFFDPAHTYPPPHCDPAEDENTSGTGLSPARKKRGQRALSGDVVSIHLTIVCLLEHTDKGISDMMEGLSVAPTDKHYPAIVKACSI